MRRQGDRAALLEVTALDAGYGSMRVVTGVSFTIAGGEVVGFVGRNGAGKTTTLNAVAGLRHGRSAGQVQLGGVELSGAAPTRIVAAGLALVPAGHRVFTDLKVIENLHLGAYALRHQLSTAELRQRVAGVCDLFPALGPHLPRPAGYLSGGEQQMVAIGQALMGEPAVIMLDEPTSGLAPAMVEAIFSAMRALCERGIGVLVVEQNVQRALARCDRCYVMDRGRIVMSGASLALRDDPALAEVISGVSAAPPGGS